MSTKSSPPPGVGRRRQTAAEAALDANALELFARIAQAGSFAQAARDLGLTRAAISRRISAIENAEPTCELFARLVIRNACCRSRIASARVSLC